jgi:hypothetical protein
MQFIPFTFDDGQAMITAKWQVGVRNYTLPFAVLPFAVPVFYELLRRAFRLSLPAFTPGVPHLSIAALYLMLLLFVYYRLRRVADSLKGKQLAVAFDGDTVVVRKDDQTLYITRNEDIKRLDYGVSVVRIQSDYGAYCLPRSVVPEPTFLQPMAEKLEKNFIYHAWM